MINSVRETVLSVLNKNNYGYLSPSDFNLFAKQAQTEIFIEYFQTYNSLINSENIRRSGTDYADMRRNMEENMEVFFRVDPLVQDANNEYFLPSITTTGYEYFFINKILCKSNTGSLLGEAEKVSNGKITMLAMSNLTAPTEKYPAYTIQGDKITVYPDTINGASSVDCYYFRYPKDPKWTYVSLINGAPMFDATQPDYQDFEVRPEDEVTLVIKILEYAGISIRESEVYSFAKTEEREKYIQQSPNQQQ